MISRTFAAFVWLLPAAAFAQNIALPIPSPNVIGPAGVPCAGPGPVSGPYGASWGGRHPIYDYLPAHDSVADIYGVAGRYGYGGYYGGYGYGDRRYDNTNNGKVYPGRSTLDPAVPFSDYLAWQRRLQATLPTPSTTPATTAPFVPPVPQEISADRATLEISMPTEAAKLFLDGTPVDGDGKVRNFQTPPLTAAKDYRFTVKATWPSNNPFEDNSTEQVVTFRAGDRKVVELRAKK